MLLFSRSKSPWVAVIFIAVIAVGAFMRFEQNAEIESEKLKADKVGFVEFQKDLAALDMPEKIMKSQMLFELYRCGVRSITERNYCERIGEEVFHRMTKEQREAARPIIDKYFNKR